MKAPFPRASGLRGIPGAAEEVMIARDIFLSQLTGSRLHIAHVSTAASVALIRDAKKRDSPLPPKPPHIILPSPMN